MHRRALLLKGSILLLFFPLGCSLPYVNSYRNALSPEEHLKLAMAYEQNEEHEGAIREYTAASAEIAEAHYYLGNIYFTRGEYQSAEQHYRLAIEKLPRDPRAYNNLAWLYFMEKKNLEQAESLALRGLKLAPKENTAPYRDTVERIRAAQKKERSP